MIFKKIRWKNLISYGKTWTEMNLDSNLTVNIIGENGAGKSVFVEAVFIALTGKPLRKIRKEQAVNFKNKKNCLVELTVQAGKHNYLIKRGIKPSVFTIDKDGVPIDESSMMMDTQTYLEMVLGFTKKNLKNTIIMSTTDYTPFLRLPAADKRLFVEDILSIEVFSIMNKLIKSKLSILKEDIRDNQTDIEKLQYKLNMILEYNKQQRLTNDDEIAECTQNIITEKTSLTDDLESMRNQNQNAIRSEAILLKEKIGSAKTNALLDIEEEKVSLVKTIEDLKAKARECKTVLAGLKTKTGELEQSISEAKTYHENIGANRSVIYDDMVKHTLKYEADMEKHRVNLDKGSKARFQVSTKRMEKCEDLRYYEENDECTQCKQDIHHEFRQKQLDNLRDEIGELATKLEKIESELEKLAAFKTRVDEYKANKIDPLNDKCTAMEKEMSGLQVGWSQAKNEINVIESKQQACKRQMVDFKETRDNAKRKAAKRIAGYEDIGSIIDKLTGESADRADTLNANLETDIKKQTGTAERRIEGQEKKIADLKSEKRGNLKDEEAPAAEVAGAENSKKTLAFNKLVHDAAIKILSDKGIKTYIIKRYIPKLNKLVNQYLEILSAPYKLSFDEELNESIALKGYDKLSYNNFSEGERQRADIALLFAFLDIGKLKNSVVSNILIMDEIFDRSLDDLGIRGIIDIIDSMKAKGFSIFNISHKHQLADKFDKTLLAEKSQFSKLEAI